MIASSPENPSRISGGTTNCPSAKLISRRPRLAIDQLELPIIDKMKAKGRRGQAPTRRFRYENQLDVDARASATQAEAKLKEDAAKPADEGLGRHEIRASTRLWRTGLSGAFQRLPMPRFQVRSKSDRYFFRDLCPPPARKPPAETCARPLTVWGERALARSKAGRAARGTSRGPDSPTLGPPISRLGA